MMRRSHRKLALLLSMVLGIGVMLITGTTALAGGQCASTPSQAATLWGGDMSDWTKIPNTDSTGWKFQSADGDEYVRAPFVGTLTFDTGQYLWSDSSHTRRIWIDHGTVWCRDKRGANNNRPLSRVVRSARQAANKYRAGTAANWTRQEGSQSEGWIANFASRTQVYAFHGHIDHEYGKTWAGDWTPAVYKASAWYLNN
jgi:hypothetical protein